LENTHIDRSNRLPNLRLRCQARVPRPRGARPGVPTHAVLLPRRRGLRLRRLHVSGAPGPRRQCTRLASPRREVLLERKPRRLHVGGAPGPRRQCTAGRGRRGYVDAALNRTGPAQKIEGGSCAIAGPASGGAVGKLRPVERCGGESRSTCAPCLLAAAGSGRRTRS
jgi:hypothetical protein